MAQVLIVLVDKSFMVAELLARSPIFSSVSQPNPATMVLQGSPTPYLRLPIKDWQPIEMTIGVVIAQVGITIGGVVLGASALAEARDAIAEVLVEKLGKYQTADHLGGSLQLKDTDGCPGGLIPLKDTEVLNFDGTPDSDISKKLFNDCDDGDGDKAAKDITKDKVDDGDDAAKGSVKTKRDKFQAMISKEINKAKAQDVTIKMVSVDEMLDAQREQIEHYIAKLIEQERLQNKEAMKTLVEEWKQQLLQSQTTIRQQDVEIQALENKNTDAEDIHSKSQDPWHGKSPGPEVLQNRAGTQPTQTPMEKRIDTPEDKEWEDILDEQVKGWASLTQKTGNTAPRTKIVQRRIVHNFRELVEQDISKRGGANNKFKHIKKQTRGFETPKSKILRFVYSPSSGGSIGSGQDGGDFNNLGKRDGGRW